ncbi:MAG: hypothetical protein ACXWUB_09685 [Burkholderiales bacterium]
MSLVGQKAAVVSFGISCQTTLQIDDHAELIARAIGDETLKSSSLPFDAVLTHPTSTARMLDADTFYPASKDEIRLYRGALWVTQNAYFRHECTLRKSHPLEYLRGKVNLDRGYRELASKFAHLSQKFRRLRELERLIFVVGNSQNDLPEMQSEIGNSSDDSVISMESMQQLCDACDRYFGRPCEYILVAYPSLRTGTGSRRGLSVFDMTPDETQWAGDHAQWRALWTDYFRANPVALAKQQMSA